MGYLGIPNLYKDKDGSFVKLFQRVYVLEKIHGTSAHISFDLETKKLRFFSGGEQYERFCALFDAKDLESKFQVLTQRLEQEREATLSPIGKYRKCRRYTVHGEAYGGKQQKMSHTYGDKLRFIAFDVVRDLDSSLDSDCKEGKQEFIGARAISATCPICGIDIVTAEKFAHRVDSHLVPDLNEMLSQQAVRNGITEPRRAEGCVLRPIQETFDHRGDRIIYKHKSAAFSEHKTPKTKIATAPATKPAPQVPTKVSVPGGVSVPGDVSSEVSPSDRAEGDQKGHQKKSRRQKNCKDANLKRSYRKVAENWVTHMRLAHVLDQLKSTKSTPPTLQEIVDAMYNDVIKESASDGDRELLDEIEDEISVSRGTLTHVPAEMKKEIDAVTARVYKQHTSKKEKVEKKRSDDDPRMYLIVNDELGMSAGEVGAQVAHCAVALYIQIMDIKASSKDEKEKEALEKWESGYQAKIVLKASKQEWAELEAVAHHVVCDAGLTEVNPGSKTVLGFRPMYARDRSAILKGLKLY